MVRFNLLLLLTLFISCNGEVVNSNSKYKSYLKDDSAASPNYGPVKEIMSAKCSTCHSAGQNFPELPPASEANLFDGKQVIPGNPEGSEIYKRLLGQGSLMPPSGALPPDDIELVRVWIAEMGGGSAGNGGGGTGAPPTAPPVGPAPASPEFEAFMSVIMTKCIWCHDDNDSYPNSDSFRLPTQQDWIDSGLVVGQNFADSLILTRIKGAAVTPATEDMPQNLPNISQSDIEKVKTWINSFQGGAGGGGGPAGSTPESRYLAARDVITRRCQNCHSGNNPSGNLQLNYNTEQQYIDSGAVVRNNLAESDVYRDLRGVNVGGQQDMPQGGGTLPPAEIAALRDWIQQLP